MALDEVRKLKGGLMKAVKKLGYTNHTFHEVMASMEADPEQGFSTRPEVLEFFTSGLERIQTKMIRYVDPSKKS